MKQDVLVLVLAFALGTAGAEALGADSLGTALGIGQLAFAGALVWVLLRAWTRA